MIKKFFLTFFATLFLLIVLTLGWGYYCLQGVCWKNCQEQIFVVPQGTTVNGVFDKLQKEKLIRSALAAKIYLKLTKFRGQIQAGDFKINTKYNLQKIIAVLQKGTLDFWLTIPEGWRGEQIYERVQKERNAVIANPSVASGEAILPETKDNEIATSSRQGRIPRNDKGLEIYKQNEGYLFPDTYLIPKSASDEDIVKIMKNNFNAKIDQFIRADKILLSNGDEITLNDLIILASLVEREAKKDEERPIIANIIYRRWKAGWRLQVDATVQYIVGHEGDWWSKNLAYGDLAVNSEYNTYLSSGLPPTPICNPGMKAIEAVINQTQTDYWFYSTGKDGVTRFAKTLEGHNDNINRYINIR